MFNPAACDVPRNAPLPTCREQPSLAPSVPEISMILSNTQAKNAFHDHASFQKKQVIAKNNKENILGFSEQEKPLNHSELQKQVRFYDPSRMQAQVTKPVMRKILPDKTNVLPDTIFPKNRTKFTDVYLANVPNRHLDLSIIDNSSQRNCSTNNASVQDSSRHRIDSFADLIASNKEFNCNNMRKEKNDTFGISNVRDYKSNNANCEALIDNSGSNMSNMLSNQRETTALEKRCNAVDSWGQVTVKSSNDEPTVKDLLKIIQQQNEQLLILQKQVSHLIEYQAAQRIERPQIPIAGSHITDYYCQRQTNVFGDVLTTEKRDDFKPQNLNKGPLSKFAIDVTTSFEVSVRRQQNLEQRNTVQPCFREEQKIQDITNQRPTFASNQNGTNSTDKVMKIADTSRSMSDSLVLDNQLRVREECPSPVNSIHVDMNDYSSESDDDSTSSSSNIDWTLYNNIMEQVNHILKKAQTSPVDKSQSERGYKNETMKKVMEATVKHLKSVGINLAGTNNPDHVQRLTEDTKNYTSTEISFAVKQLLMKYLPPEHLAKLACTRNSDSSSSGNSEEMVDLVKKRPEFSFATLQYMRKYNLIRSEETVQNRQMNGIQNQGNNTCPKILDITALKQQPKLL